MNGRWYTKASQDKRRETKVREDNSILVFDSNLVDESITV